MSISAYLIVNSCIIYRMKGKTQYLLILIPMQVFFIIILNIIIKFIFNWLYLLEKQHSYVNYKGKIRPPYIPGLDEKYSKFSYPDYKNYGN